MHSISHSIYDMYYLLLGKEMETHSSFLAWEIPQTDNPGGLLSMGSQRVGHDLETKQQ